MKKRLVLLSKATLVAIYLIFIAGSIVRMTGSGMGCPDWPKCFGYYIPPTNEAQIQWKANTSYSKGSAIVKDAILYTAQTDITTKEAFNTSNWEEYTKHSYSTFNVLHTWTEYINRLASVVAGLVYILLFISASYYWKENKKIPILTYIGFLFVLIAGWLGAKVVETVLNPQMITIHMFVGIVPIICLILLINEIQEITHTKKYHKLFMRVLIFATIASFVQIFMGTQVRQFVDEQVKLIGFENKQMSLYEPNLIFYIHRSFSILIVLMNAFLWYKNEMEILGFNSMNWIAGIIGIEVLSGILMYYVDFPIGTQSVHFVFGIILFGMHLYLLLRVLKAKKKTRTS